MRGRGRRGGGRLHRDARLCFYVLRDLLREHGERGEGGRGAGRYRVWGVRDAASIIWQHSQARDFLLCEQATRLYFPEAVESAEFVWGEGGALELVVSARGQPHLTYVNVETLQQRQASKNNQRILPMVKTNIIMRRIEDILSRMDKREISYNSVWFI